MKVLLLLHDLETDWWPRLKKILPLLPQVPDEIILQYSYQIPADSHDVIADHDEIKRRASRYVDAQSALISEASGLQVCSQITLGAIRNTFKRTLLKFDVDYILADHRLRSNIDGNFKQLFPNISFIFTTSENFKGLPYVAVPEVNTELLRSRLNLDQMRLQVNGRVDVKVLQQRMVIPKEEIDTIIVL